MISSKLKPGVVFGPHLKDLYDYANAEKFAIPAVNVIGTNTINAVLETARDVNSPVIIQFSNGGASFLAGKGVKTSINKLLYLVPYPEPCIYTSWPKLMGFRLSFILTIVLKSFYHG